MVASSLQQEEFQLELLLIAELLVKQLCLLGEGKVAE